MVKAKKAVETDEPAATEDTGEVEQPVLVDEEANGQGRIPGTEFKAIKALIAFGQRREETKAAHKKATADLKEQNDVEAPQLFQKYKEHFEETEDAFIYTAGGIEIEMIKGAMKCKTHTLGDE